jgi:dolichol-phosphate mannosyltransferase
MAGELISIIVPVYNEEPNVRRAYAAIVEALAGIGDVDYEIVFTDNHSTDGTFRELQVLAAADPRVRVLRFARNFGFHRSILTGYRHARGDAAIQIDCDLEDPPSLFPAFIQLWRDGHDVVVGIRTERAEGAATTMLRRVFYRLLRRISDVPLAIDAGDFRLVDRHILDQLRGINDAQPYVRGLISELARNQAGVPYRRGRREFAQSKFPLRQMVKLAMDGIFAYSTVPLRIATYCGLFIAIVTALLAGIYVFYRVLVAREFPPGFATTTVLILFGISLNAIFLGIIGEYVGRIYNQVRTRPTVVIEKMINLGGAGEHKGKDAELGRLQ